MQLTLMSFKYETHMLTVTIRQETHVTYLIVSLVCSLYIKADASELLLSSASINRYDSGNSFSPAAIITKCLSTNYAMLTQTTSE